MSIDPERRRINRELTAGRISAVQAQRQLQDLYNRDPAQASALFDPDNHHGRFTPTDPAALTDLRRGAHFTPHRMKVR
jgi:hypothetical protein